MRPRTRRKQRGKAKNGTVGKDGPCGTWIRLSGELGFHYDNKEQTQRLVDLLYDPEFIGNGAVIIKVAPWWVESRGHNHMAWTRSNITLHTTRRWHQKDDLADYLNTRFKQPTGAVVINCDRVRNSRLWTPMEPSE